MHRLVDKCRPLYRNPDFRLLFILNLLVGFGYSFVGPFMSMFGTSAEVGMSDSTFGLFMTLIQLSSVLVGTVMAHFSDTRFSRRSMLLLGSVAAVIAYTGFAFCRSFTWLLVDGVCVLCFSNITFAQLFAYARELLGRSEIQKDQRAFYMNAFRMFFALSWTGGPALAQWVMRISGSHDYEALFLSAAAIFAVFGVVVYFRIPAVPPPKSAPGKGASESLLRLLLRWDLMAHLLAFVLITATSSIGMTNLPLLITKTLMGNKNDVGYAYCVGPIFEIPFMLYFGWLATKHDTAKIIRIGIGIALVYYVSLACITAPWQVYFAQILSAASTAVVSGVAITYFQSHLPHHPGTATNLYSNASRIGSTLGYFVFIFVSVFGYRMVFAICAGFALAALLLMFVSVHVPDDEATVRPESDPEVA